jgi:hypothetical protein
MTPLPRLKLRGTNSREIVIDRYTDRQQGDLIGLLSFFFQNEERMLKRVTC